MNMLCDIWDAWSKAITSLTLGSYLQALSLPISMLVAWLTVKSTSVNLRYTIIVAEVTGQIKALAECCSKLASQIECHYLGSYEGGFTPAAAKESRKRIMAQMKELEDRRAVLNVFLTRKIAAQLEQEFDCWGKAALGENFPVTRKAEICKEFDLPVMELRKAETKFECYLATLRKKCIDHGKKFRRVLC